MTTIKTAQQLNAKSLLFTSTGLVALALLTGCATNDGGAGAPATQKGTTSVPAGAQTSPGADQTNLATGEDTAPASPTSTDDIT